MTEKETIQKIISMNKDDNEITKKNVKRIIDCFKLIIREELKNNKKYVIPKLCVFIPKKLNPRKARNPKTGETFHTEEKKSFLIKPSREFVHSLN